MFSFIHCADIHLGCFPYRNETRFHDFFNAFKNVIDYAITHQIKLILVSGDFFQLRAINPKTLDLTISLLQKAKEFAIEVVVIEGNHDQAYFVDEDSWLSFLHSQKYLHLLKSDINNGKVLLKNYDGINGNTIENEKYRIIGIDYLGGSTEKYLQDLSQEIEKKNKYTILMLHAAINRLVGQNMGDVKSEVILELKEKVNYLALGHIHYNYEFADFAYNPGSLENIRIRDGAHHKKGFYHVHVFDDYTHEVKFIDSNPRKTYFLKYDLSELKLPEESLKLITNKEIEKEAIIEVNLYGKVDFNPYLINLEEIKNYFLSQYQAVIVEVNNYLNLLKEVQPGKEDDLSTIIENLITDEIKINYPEVKDPEKMTQTILNLTQVISEDLSDDDIINILVEEVEDDN